MKKIFALCSVLIFTIRLLAYDAYVDGIYYNLNSTDLTAMVTSGSNKYVGSVIIPSSVTYNSQTYSVATIGDWAFQICSSLTSVTIPNSVTTIGEGAFERCSGLTSITIPHSVTTIEFGTFSGCSSLISVAIPNSVTTIGELAFYNCGNIQSIIIPSSVTKIESDAFYGCTGLKTVYNNSNLNIVKGLKNYGYVAYYAEKVYSGMPIGDFVIKNDTIVTGYIGTATDVVIPYGITTIGDYAFRWCNSLTSVTIPNSVTTIGNFAFSGCSGLTLVTIPNSVTTIGNYAFSGCSGLTSVAIPNSVTTIGSSAFYECDGLKKTNCTGTIADWCKIKFSDIFANPMYYSHNFYINDVEVKDLIIPNSITTIGYSAFSGCSGLTSVTIPNSVTTIESYAFYNCRGLTSMTCDAITPPTCGSNCFYEVSKSIPVYVLARAVDTYKKALCWKDFTNIQANPNDFAVITCIAKNGTSIGADTYIKGDTCILKIIPNVGYRFSHWNDGNTDNPRSVVVTQDSIFTAQIDSMVGGQCGNNLYWRSVGDTLIITGSGEMYDYSGATPAEWSFLSKDKIAKIILQDGMTHIGDSAFIDCNGIETLSLPNSVETIGKYTFANCPYLTDVVIGANVKEIGCSAFAGDFRLENITCYAPITPNVCSTTFSGINKFYVYLYVLESAQRKYQVDPNWAGFNLHLIGAEEKPITGDEVTVDSSADNATFTWPQNDQAAGYSIEITKDGIVFCTLTFNAQGQLTGIAFAPNRVGSRMLDAAVMTSNGWQFTVTGLDQASKYGYALDAFNASKQSIKHYEGEFATDGYTSLEWVTSDKIQGVNKMLLDGHLYILRDGNLYTATGARVK